MAQRKGESREEYLSRVRVDSKAYRDSHPGTQRVYLARPEVKARGMIGRCCNPKAHDYDATVASLDNVERVLLIEHITRLLSRGYCEYCGRDTDPHAGARADNLPSIDACVRSLGHALHRNLVACCWKCNQLKNGCTPVLAESFLRVARDRGLL